MEVRKRTNSFSSLVAVCVVGLIVDVCKITGNSSGFVAHYLALTMDLALAVTPAQDWGLKGIATGLTKPTMYKCIHTDTHRHTRKPMHVYRQRRLHTHAKTQLHSHKAHACLQTQ
jgi:hypothetical protein